MGVAYVAVISFQIQSLLQTVCSRASSLINMKLSFIAISQEYNAPVFIYMDCLLPKKLSLTINTYSA